MEEGRDDPENTQLWTRHRILRPISLTVLPAGYDDGFGNESCTVTQHFDIVN